MKSSQADMAVFLSVMLAVLNVVCCAIADAATVDGEVAGDGRVHAMAGRRDSHAYERRRDGGGG